MRACLILAVLLLGCSGEDPDPHSHFGDIDASPYAPTACGAVPQHCLGRLCWTETADFGEDDCCDSEQCNCNPETLEWEVWYCHEAPPDAGVDR